MLINEEKLVLLLSRTHLSPEVMEHVKGLIQKEHPSPDYNRITELAAKNGVAPLLWNNIKETDIFPENIRARLRNIYLLTVKNNMLNSNETMRIIALLKDKGIRCIPLKGALASEMIFGNIGLYPAGDIDILVRPSDLYQAEKILNEAGYKKMKGVDEQDLISSHYHFIFQNDKNDIVELHWNLVKRYFHVSPDFWWEDTGKTRYEGLEIIVLSVERYLMYTIFRLFDHCFRPLKFLVIIAGIIDRYEKEIEWNRLIVFSKRYKMERLVIFTLKILHELLGVRIPEDMKNRKIHGHSFFKRNVISGNFHEIERPHLRMFTYTFLLDSPLSFSRMIMKRILPDMGEIRLRYGLSERSKKIYAYYLLNPLLILLKKNKA